MTFTTYLGIELLDWSPDRPESADEPVQGGASTIVSTGGQIVPFWLQGSSIWTRTFQYVTRTRDDLATLYDFCDRRTGRYSPCWVPTWSDDIVPTTSLASGATGITIVTPSIATVRAIGTVNLRHAAVLPVSGGTYPTALQSTFDNGDGTTTVDTSGYSGPSLAAPPGWRFSALKYVRLVSDQVAFDYSVPGIVTASLVFVELPLETP